VHTLYHNAPDGLSGNEDCGQMSSWYVLSALGFYQIAPGRPIYDFGTPLLDDALIQLSNRNRLRIKTTRESAKSIYIDRIVFNGKELNQRFIRHEQLLEGGKLEYYLTDAPSKNYRNYKQAPTIDKIPNTFVAAPFRIETERIFDEQTSVTLGCVTPAEIIYTTDGSNPKVSSTARTYESSIPINETSTLKAFAKTDSGESSVVTTHLVKKNPNIKIKILSEYANQYAAFGDLTMIDGIIGGTEYRTGDWQGYWAQDLQVELTFEQPKMLKEIALGCLEDTKSWIFLPNAVIFEGSQDGIEFEVLGMNKLIHTATSVEPAVRKEFNLPFEKPKEFKKIRITALNYGKCPEWHLGAGNDTWLFVDEIILK
jgi:hypothetical protein